MIGCVLLGTGVAVPVAAQAHPEGFHVLLFSKTAAGAYRHDSIPAGITMFEQLAAQNEWELTRSEDSSVFNDAALATFDVVVMLQTSGMVWDNDAQRAAAQKYMRGGGGFVAIHNATDMNIEQQFPWWDQMLGASMTAHSAIVSGTAKVADRKHPSGAALPDRWTRTEEWYNFTRSVRGTAHVLVTADESTYDPGSSRMGADHPISWCRNFEGGRLWATAMGHQASSYSEPLFREHVKGGVESAGGKVQADCGPTSWSSFEKIALDETTIAPGAVDIAPDGRVFFTEYGGKLKIYKPDTRTTVTAATLNVYGGGQNSEDGLTGLALDPDFATNRWVYLNYSPGSTTEEAARISRFTMNGDAVDLSTEKVLLKVPMSRKEEPGHTGGYLAFGPGKNLYVGVGDDTNPFASDGYAPIDERPGRSLYDAQGTAANTNDLRGKILRIHPEADGTYTVPQGNLFAPGTARTRPEIYAMGFRNPFRFSVHPTTGVVYLADYGPDAGSDNPNRGPGGLVEWNVVKSPGNYGWPYCVGNNTPYNDFNFATGTSGGKFNCAAPVNNSPNNTGLSTLPAARAADVWYGNSASEGNKFPEMGSGGEAPMAFPIYRYNAANPSPTKFPAYFDGTPFLGEWARNTMFEFRLDSSGNLLKINNFLSGMSFASPMDAKFGPDGSMYLLTWGEGWDDNVHLPGAGLFRIDYSAGERSPVARATATPGSGGTPLTVRFSSAGSSDPEGGALRYSWRFGDGGTSTEANPSHTYTTRGTFNAQLTVTDPSGRTGTANVTVTSGNTAPTVTVTSPADGAMFAWGDTIPYAVSVSDPEDGTIDCARVITQGNIGHDAHKHPLGGPITGCSGSLKAEADAEHQNGNAHIIGSTEYADKGATGLPSLTGSATVVLQPKHKQAEFFNGSSGVRVVSQAGAESGARVGDISNNDWISFKPVNFTGINQVSFKVSSPTGGGSVELRSGSPTGPLIASAPVVNTGNWDNYVSTPPVNVTKPGGTVELFVVFKSSANNNFDLDSITYIGPGAGSGGGGGGAKEIVGVGGKCVDVNGGASTDGAKVQLWTCNGQANQKWTQTGSTFRTLDKCLDVNGGSQVDGTLVQLWSCNGSSGQNWSVQSDGTIRNGAKCLDANGGSSADGTQLIIWTCTGGTNQRWTLR
ncbi:ThuA domain-containing protein [Saccharothrix luteola]|uniref:ThuA domain-containing protein n=1 Tax=Saccharothrix luteola TaxID=2893018 RepID=UPI001E3C27FA|nr:ThuA domain-containing protein [Saccharothrix luteola]MCC8250812.1 ThuA domain-containing protein [Saccharothrix luteola]